MISTVRLCSCLLFLSALAGARADSSPAAIDLFNGKDLRGWTLVTPSGTDIAKVCHVRADGVMAVAGKPVGYLLAAGTYANYRIHFEWRWPPDAKPRSNSGLLLHIASGPIDRHTWPLCFQIQTKAGRGGDLLPMAGAKFAEPLSTPPGAKTPQLDRRNPGSEKPFGQWNSCDALCRDGVIECWINGVFQNRVTRCQPSSGRIGIQLEGYPYELRHVRLEPLD